MQPGSSCDLPLLSLQEGSCQRQVCSSLRHHTPTWEEGEINRWQSVGCSSPRLGAHAGCLLLLSIYQVKVIALEMPDLLTLRDEVCLVWGSTQKASCASEQSLRKKEGVCVDPEIGTGGPGATLAWGGLAWEQGGREVQRLRLE